MTVGADIKVVDVVGDDRRAGFVQLKYPERTRTDVVHRLKVILAGLLAERERHGPQFPVDPSRSTDEWNVADICQRWGIGRSVYEDVLCKTTRLWASDWFHDQVGQVCGLLDRRPVIDGQRLKELVAL